jgi:hypothetical protein
LGLEAGGAGQLPSRAAIIAGHGSLTSVDNSYESKIIEQKETKRSRLLLENSSLRLHEFYF